ncbi:MAG: 4'-phosphopantetheinyl transferase superfamily protein [Ruminococcaceae bacterium]|nr:4'-phosphopantetheinyl transferase superfamily protein [Oscillospiraceae bacterium]
MNKIYILPINTDYYGFIKQAASEKYNIEINSLKMEKGEHGKPFFKDLPNFHFNVSHSGELLVIAISQSAVGVDIEKKRKLNPKIAKRFHPQEIDYINSKPSESRFLEIWTKKEACLKYLGAGLSGGLDTFSVFEFSPTPKTFTHGEYYISVCGQNEFEIIK